MNADIKLMLNIYQTYDIDWLGDKITKIDKLTRHHIQKKEENGENGISNYALLTSKSHNLLNEIEQNDKYIFNSINTMFLKLNRSLTPPTSKYYTEISKLLKLYKKNYQLKR